MTRLLRTALHRASQERGYTLVELLIVMLIMLVVIGGLADGFASATKAEVDQVKRASDQQNARQALQRMRLDIHCAVSVQPAAAQGTGYLLTLPQPNPDCPGVQTSGNSAVQWCTVQISTSRWTLYRSTIDCSNPADATFQVDYVTQANVWPTTTCTSGEIPTVAVDMPVNRDPIKRPGRTYRLQDTIAMRNAPAC